MNTKIIIASVIIIAALIFGAISFVETNVEYADFHTAVTSGKKVQVKGEWMRDTTTMYDANRNQFVFFLKDDNGLMERVVYDGARPNNFELATAVVVKGRFEQGSFHASDILTKCPSKYEADNETVKKSL
jgi:cytochrome c-type biogenesis protein CcmE